jgi:hypothetical protein
MSTYFKVWNATISAPDPETYTPENPPVVGNYANAKPVSQGRERGMATWSSMTIAEFIDLWDKWNTSKDTSGTFVIPGRTSGQSWTTWRSVTAYAEEPTCVYQNNQVMNVAMRIVIP